MNTLRIICGLLVSWVVLILFASGLHLPQLIGCVLLALTYYWAFYFGRGA